MRNRRMKTTFVLSSWVHLSASRLQTFTQLKTSPRLLQLPVTLLEREPERMMTWYELVNLDELAAQRDESKDSLAGWLGAPLRSIIISRLPVKSNLKLSQLEWPLSKATICLLNPNNLDFWIDCNPSVIGSPLKLISISRKNRYDHCRRIMKARGHTLTWMEAGKLAILTLPSSFCQSGKAGRVQLGAGKLETIPVSSRSLAHSNENQWEFKGGSSEWASIFRSIQMEMLPVAYVWPKLKFAQDQEEVRWIGRDTWRFSDI